MSDIKEYADVMDWLRVVHGQKTPAPAPFSALLWTICRDNQIVNYVIRS